ncbi:MAG: hypothetical protein CFE21_09295 [Bacteroidetes bacterium B1(2017)]|nr:MAG: hypothetical protein CFE21_09295 [Bacteroidetes bacterium B1(2017)]
MKSLNTINSLFLSIFILTACNNTIEVKESYADGQAKVVNYFINNSNENFEQKVFDEKGQIKTTRQFENNKQVGFEKQFYTSGELAGDMEYKNGMRNGKSHEYHKNGKLAFEGYCYPDSSFCGLSTWYYDNGQIKKTGNRNRDIGIGIWYEYYRNGKKRSILDFDKKHFVYFSALGDTISENEYKGTEED